jgi:hypothetical protein
MNTAHLSELFETFHAMPRPRDATANKFENQKRKEKEKEKTSSAWRFAPAGGRRPCVRLRIENKNSDMAGTAVRAPGPFLSFRATQRTRDGMILIDSIQ